MARTTQDRILALALLALAPLLLFILATGLDETSLRCERGDGGVTCDYTRSSPWSQRNSARTLRLGDPDFIALSCFAHSGKNGSHCGIGISTAGGRFYELFDPDGTREDFARLERFFDPTATERTIEARRAAMSPVTLIFFALLALGSLWGAVRLLRRR